MVLGNNRVVEGAGLFSFPNIQIRWPDGTSVDPPPVNYIDTRISGFATLINLCFALQSNSRSVVSIPNLGFR
ncbi:uncharacterized protein EAF01_011519 [Botrytis porri]|uniref:Uncharacterized protein n=1 Tax=Botrytis porri TaxID=87229 RepID=A0A4Z1KTF7_9HELO|nr:uncharacterized protein EAF01_011519 [Botrytis porri]KAF7884096.1 hypothetical protein EAF01_011519 [Botrytis porri]TGO87479.1 hypothetical protein BPOR_0223g00060 [Botrytis porri]